MHSVHETNRHPPESRYKNQGGQVFDDALGGRSVWMIVLSIATRETRAVTSSGDELSGNIRGHGVSGLIASIVFMSLRANAPHGEDVLTYIYATKTQNINHFATNSTSRNVSVRVDKILGAFGPTEMVMQGRRRGFPGIKRFWLGPASSRPNSSSPSAALPNRLLQVTSRRNGPHLVNAVRQGQALPMVGSLLTRINRFPVFSPWYRPAMASGACSIPGKMSSRYLSCPLATQPASCFRPCR